MKPKGTDTGNTTAMFIDGGYMKQHPGWYLQKVKKNVILPLIASIPFSAMEVVALPSGYYLANNISISPSTTVQFFTDESEQFPTPHKEKHFKVEMKPDGYQYFMVVSDKKMSFSKDFEILLEDTFEDMWFHSEYAHIAYARIPSSTPVPVTLDSFNTICISPF